MSISFYMRDEVDAKGKKLSRPYYKLDLVRPSSNSNQDAPISYSLEGYVDEDIKKQYPRECNALAKALKEDKEKIEKLLIDHPGHKVEIEIGPLEDPVIIDTSIIVKANKEPEAVEVKKPVKVIKTDH